MSFAQMRVAQEAVLYHIGLPYLSLHRDRELDYLNDLLDGSSVPPQLLDMPSIKDRFTCSLSLHTNVSVRQIKVGIGTLFPWSREPIDDQSELC